MIPDMTVAELALRGALAVVFLYTAVAGLAGCAQLVFMDMQTRKLAVMQQEILDTFETAFYHKQMQKTQRRAELLAQITKSLAA